jgi:hypothetical protein
MRHVQPLVLAQDTAEFRLNFQMISSGARHACSVTIRATDAIQAATLFRDNWPAIEELARKNLATSAAKQFKFDAGLTGPASASTPGAGQTGEVKTSKRVRLARTPSATLEEHLAQ